MTVPVSGHCILTINPPSFQLLKLATVDAVLGKYASVTKVKDGNTVGVDLSGDCVLLFGHWHGAVTI